MKIANKIMKLMESVLEESNSRNWYDSRNNCLVWQFANSDEQSKAEKILKDFSSDFKRLVDRVYKVSGNKVSLQLSDNAERSPEYSNLVSQMKKVISQNGL